MQEKILIVDLDNYLSRFFYVNQKTKETMTNEERLKYALYNSRNIAEIFLKRKGSLYKNIIFSYDTHTGKNRNYEKYQNLLKEFNIEGRSYKDGRKKDEIFDDYKKHIKNLFYISGFPLLGSDFYESDDIMATLRKKYAKENYKVHILSRDRDMFQVISENINVIEHLDEGLFEEIDEKKALELTFKKHGIKLNNIKEIVCLKCILGDTSDKITGVKGIGKGTLKKDMDKNGGDIYETNTYKNNMNFILKLKEVIALEENITKDKIILNKTEYDEEKYNNYLQKFFLNN